MLQAFQHFRLFLETLAFLALEIAVLQLAPGDGDARLRVETLENGLEGAATDFLFEFEEAPGGRSGNGFEFPIILVFLERARVVE